MSESTGPQTPAELMQYVLKEIEGGRAKDFNKAFVVLIKDDPQNYDRGLISTPMFNSELVAALAYVQHDLIAEGDGEDDSDEDDPPPGQEWRRSLRPPQ